MSQRYNVEDIDTPPLFIEGGQRSDESIVGVPLSPTTLSMRCHIY